MASTSCTSLPTPSHQSTSSQYSFITTPQQPTSPSLPKSTPRQPNPCFHIFRTLMWLEYPWKTVVFTPPKIHCAFEEDHCHALLVSRPGFNTISESHQHTLEALAHQIDAFAIQVSRNHAFQSKLNKGFDHDIGSENHIILYTLVKSILLDKFCWAFNLGVSGTYSQHRLCSNNDDNHSPIRGYRQASKTVRTLLTSLRVMQSIPCAGSTNLDQDGDSYLGLAFGTWYAGKKEACAVTANLCFASVACLCFIHVSHIPFLIFLIPLVSHLYIIAGLWYW